MAGFFRASLSIAVALMLLIGNTRAFYLPGVAPEEYQKGSPIYVKAEKLTSTRTQLPYEYYTLPFCQPDHEGLDSEWLNLGEIMHGSRIHNTPYKFTVGEEKHCQVLCRNLYRTDEIEEFAAFIEDDYRVNMLLDNLPLAMTQYLEGDDREDSPTKVYEIGYKLGFMSPENENAFYDQPEDDKIYLNNHLQFTVLYHESDAGLRIVGFEVVPFSVAHTTDLDHKEWKKKGCNGGPAEECGVSTCHIGHGASHPELELKNGEDQDVIWTYDIIWQASNIPWTARWDTYLQMQDEQVHWFSILNSFMIVLFLSGLVAMIMIRTLRNDLKRYEQLQLEDDSNEETGWKLVHGDVFRPPQNGTLLCVYVGTGVQCTLMTTVVMIFALLGFLSPANRGALMSTALFLFVFMGIFGGYHAARLYKSFKGVAWKRMTVMTALMFPGLVFLVFFAINLALWSQKSSGAIPFGTFVALLVMWFCISVPLVFLGSYFGFKKQAIEHPVRTNQIPRQVPPQPLYIHPALTMLLAGTLPFGAIFVELFFILSSIWQHQFYYLFGFLFLVFIILALTCAEITVVLCYFQLCNEDYHWWWRSYLASGSCTIYMLAYTILYYSTRLQITKFVPTLVFFGYMFIGLYAFFVVTGSVGFYACFWFVRKIYGSVKVD